jgi:hypothetical protein
MAVTMTSNVITIADDATFSVSGGNSTIAMVSENNTGYGLAWGFSYSSASTIIIFDPQGKGSTGNADNKLCMAGGGNSNVSTFKNRIGGSKNFTFALFNG